MNRQTFMGVAAGLSVAAGLAALLAPVQSSALFGLELDAVGISQTRMLGAAYLGYAPIVWYGRKVQDGAAQRSIALGSFVSWAVSLVVTAAGVIGGLGESQAWLLVVVDAIVAAAWGYFAFFDRAEVAPR
ncbi:MAG: hypothetical protein ABIP77_09620 [Candidatus Limnocylindrales bacterium]